MVAVLYEAAGNGCDLIFRFHVGLVPDGIGQVCLRAVAEDRAAVGLGGVSFLFQLVQIAADRLLRDMIIGGKVADEDALLGAELVEDLIFLSIASISGSLFFPVAIPHKTTSV